MQLQERVFEKLLKLAEIEKFGYEERTAYEDSLKVYRDLKNFVDTASREEGEKKKKALQIVNEMLRDGNPRQKYRGIPGLSAEKIERIRISSG